MKSRLVHTATLVAVALVNLLLWLETGCKRKEAEQTSQNRTTATNSTAQPGPYGFAGVPLEPDPAKRPLILSQRAPNRRQWVIQTLEQGYRDTGKTNGAWDSKVGRAFEAFADYSRVSNTNWPQLKNALAEVPVGCKDPMIAYMRIRYREQAQPETKTATEFLHAHEDIVQSRHHPLFKFFAGMRAVQSARSAYTNANRSLERARTTADLEDMARDTNAPVDEVFEAAGLWLGYSGAKEWIKFMTADLEPLLQKNWGTTPQWFLFEGKVELSRAWGERGTGWSSSVNDKGWEGFEEHLESARQFLSKAWDMNTNSAETAYSMMRVELGQGQGRTRMELWFKRAMALATNYYDAVNLMSFYLEPRWYGSESQALAFARSCVASDKWTGEVPLILVNLHRSLARYQQMSNSPAYWHRRQVWGDVKAAYDKFFALNPEATGWRHNYAKDAYDCGQYSAFLEQTKLFAGVTNYAFFGGQEKFQEMLETAAKGRKE